VSAAEQKTSAHNDVKVVENTHHRELSVPAETPAEVKTTIPPNWEIEQSDKKPAPTTANWDVYPMVYKEYVDGHVKRVPSETELKEIHGHFHPIPAAEDKDFDTSVHPQEWKDTNNK
jgi:hypothetical protein